MCYFIIYRYSTIVTQPCVSGSSPYWIPRDKALHDVSVRRVDVHELQSDLHQLEDQHADEDAGPFTMWYI